MKIDPNRIFMPSEDCSLKAGDRVVLAQSLPELRRILESRSDDPETWLDEVFIETRDMAGEFRSNWQKGKIAYLSETLEEYQTRKMILEDLKKKKEANNGWKRN